MDKKHEANQSRRRYAVGALKRIPVHAIWSGLVDVLKPEILQRRTTAHTRKGSTTAWLDGLRGVAALCVCITHLTAYTHKDLELCYGAERGALEGGGLNTSPAAWPIVRIPFTGGHFSVTVFFIISGYVVPRRLISLLHEGRKDDFVEAMNSAVFRRPGRLYLPVVWSTFFFAMVCWHLLGIEVPFPPHEKYLFPELYAWWLDMMKFFYYHREKMLFSLYNFHTWTIPVELRGSMFIFVWLFATHQMRTRPRILLTLGVLAYLVFGAHGAWYGCFFAGMLTAELDLLHAEGDPVQLPWDRVAKWFRSRRRIRQILLHFTLVCALYLASQPSSDGLPREKVLGECTGWKILNWFIPSVYNDDTNSTYRWFWLFWASWLTVISVKEIAWVRAIFESSPAQCEFLTSGSANYRAAILTYARSRQALVRSVPCPRSSHRHPRRASVLPHRCQVPERSQFIRQIWGPVQQVARCIMVVVARRRSRGIRAKLLVLRRHLHTLHVVRSRDWHEDV